MRRLLVMSDEHEHHDHDHEHEHHHHAEPVSYEAGVQGFRDDKDAYFRTGLGSPLPEAERAAFAGLPYFPIDEALRFEGLALEPYVGTEPTSFAIPTSDNRLRPAVRAGTFGFEVGGTPCTLTAYRVGSAHGHDHDHEAEDDGSVFVPFIDATSGTESYGAGRYLDLEPEDDGSYALDFNLAYHPSCVYDEKYSCPLTPAENRLTVRIEAGERLPAR
jgi:uncharacterized protein (DUF1684 family)